jgi:hypothetical protein
MNEVAIHTLSYASHETLSSFACSSLQYSQQTRSISHPSRATTMRAEWRSSLTELPRSSSARHIVSYSADQSAKGRCLRAYVASRETRRRQGCSGTARFSYCKAPHVRRSPDAVLRQECLDPRITGHILETLGRRFVDGEVIRSRVSRGVTMYVSQLSRQSCLTDRLHGR